MNRLALEVAVLHLARSINELAASLDELEKDLTAQGKSLPPGYREHMAKARHSLGEAVGAMNEGDDGRA